MSVSGINTDIGINDGDEYKYSSTETSQRGLFNESRKTEGITQEFIRTIFSINTTSKIVEAITLNLTESSSLLHQYQLDYWTSPFIFTDWAYWTGYAQNLTDEIHSFYTNVTIEEDESLFTITRHSQSLGILIGNPTQWMNVSNNDVTTYDKTSGVRINFVKNSWIHYENGTYEELDYIENLIYPSYCSSKTTCESSNSLQPSHPTTVIKIGSTEDETPNFLIISTSLLIFILSRRKFING